MTARGRTCRAQNRSPARTAEVQRLAEAAASSALYRPVKSDTRSCKGCGRPKQDNGRPLCWRCHKQVAGKKVDIFALDNLSDADD